MSIIPSAHNLYVVYLLTFPPITSYAETFRHGQ
jgi:hypothetical protein